MTHETDPQGILFTSHDLASLPNDVQQAYNAAVNRPAIAEIHVKLVSLDPGQAEVGVRIDPNGALKDGLSSGQARTAAYHQLLAALERELRQALDLLAQARYPNSATHLELNLRGSRLLGTFYRRAVYMFTTISVDHLKMVF